VGDLFSLETISFVVQKLFNFMKPHLFILCLSCWAAWVLLRKCVSIIIPKCFLLLPVVTSKFQVWYWGLWSILSWY
jgi:hypothetical protein